MSATWVLALLFFATPAAPTGGLSLYFASKDLCEAALQDFDHRAGIEARCEMIGPGAGDFGLTPVKPTPRDSRMSGK